MYSIDYSIEHDLCKASQLVNNLEHSLHMAISYAQTSPSDSTHEYRLERLLVGQAVAAVRRLKALRLELSDLQQVELGNLMTIYNLTRFYNKERYAIAIETELCVRMQIAREGLENLISNSAATIDLDAVLMERTILQEMWNAFCEVSQPDPDKQQSVEEIDEQFKRLLPRKSDFRWVPSLRTVYPADDFWWLHHERATVAA